MAFGKVAISNVCEGNGKPEHGTRQKGKLLLGTVCDVLSDDLQEIIAQAFSIKVLQHLNEYKVYKFFWQSGCAGKIYYGSKRIFLNARLFDDNEKMLKTFMHEISHAVSAFVYKYYGHGKCWQAVMFKLGQTPKRCHSHKDITRKRLNRPNKYTCKDCGYVYSTVKLLSNLQFRYHPPCKTKLNRGRLIFSCDDPFIDIIAANAQT